MRTDLDLLNEWLGHLTAGTFGLGPVAVLFGAAITWALGAHRGSPVRLHGPLLGPIVQRLEQEWRCFLRWVAGPGAR